MSGVTISRDDACADAAAESVGLRHRSEEAMNQQMRKGDLFHWHYKEGSAGANRYEPYWCTSRMAEFDGTYLIDSFWGDCDSSGRKWTPEQAEQELELTFIANRDELEQSDPSAYYYYDSADIVDLRHSNGYRNRERVFIRRGAKRSAEKMRETLEHTIERSESEIRMAQRRIEQCRELIVKLDSEPLDSLYVLAVS